MKLFVPVAFTLALSSNFIVQEVTSTILPQSIDQKQTGDYNFHLHLKDFHIIALLDSVAGDSNYEYDYEVPEEYLDITSATQNATSTILASTVTTNRPATEGTTQIISSTKKPIKVDDVSDATISDDQVKVEHKNITNDFYYPVAGKIPVVILEENSNLKTEKATTPASGNVAIISIENNDSAFNNSSNTLVDILQKKCPYGFSRDKRGRCRKNHRSQLAFNIARLASNWIRRLKYSKEESILRSNERLCNITTPDSKTEQPHNLE